MRARGSYTAVDNVVLRIAAKRGDAVGQVLLVLAMAGNLKGKNRWLSQNQIAERSGLSRSVVSRVIKALLELRVCTSDGCVYATDECALAQHECACTQLKVAWAQQEYGKKREQNSKNDERKEVKEVKGIKPPLPPLGLEKKEPPDPLAEFRGSELGEYLLKKLLEAPGKLTERLPKAGYFLCNFDLQTLEALWQFCLKTADYNPLSKFFAFASANQALPTEVRERLAERKHAAQKPDEYWYTVPPTTGYLEFFEYRHDALEPMQALDFESPEQVRGALEAGWLRCIEGFDGKINALDEANHRFVYVTPEEATAKGYIPNRVPAYLRQLEVQHG